MREPCQPNRTPIELAEVGSVFVRGISVIEQLEYVYALDAGDSETPDERANNIASLKTMAKMAEDMVIDAEGLKVWFASSWAVWMNKYPEESKKLTEAINQAAGFMVEDAKKD